MQEEMFSRFFHLKGTKLVVIGFQVHVLPSKNIPLT
jgi:hypothetical protein